MDFKSVFGSEPLTLEQFLEKTKDMKLADLSGGEYVAKGKYESDLKKAREDLSEAKKTIATLEASKGDMDAIQAELDKYKQADEQRQREEEAAAKRSKTLERFNAAKGEKEFASDFAQQGVLAAFTAALEDPANTGRGDAELFASLTKDKDGVFKSANPPGKMRGFKNTNPGAMTRDQIMAITDRGQRRAAIAANLNLFEKGE